MKIRAVHETKYDFDSEVFIEPHYLRFKPQTRPHNKLTQFNIDVFPVPIGISEQLDAENNTVHFSWFKEVHHKLHIRTEFVLTIDQYNPFHFILYPENCSELSFTYPESMKAVLHDALNPVKISDPLLTYAEKIKQEVNFKVLPYLLTLTRRIHTDFIVSSRDEGPPFEPDKTFTLKKGSCRDLTWMQMHILRHSGIATRFVSGYYYLEEASEFELHAWLEVWLPGAGWIGLDPSQGIAVRGYHIPLATSYRPENTMTVTGTFRGIARSVLKTKLLLEVID